MTSETLRLSIESAWERRAELTPADASTRSVVDEAIDLLDSGRARVAEPVGDGHWQVNEWLKKAVLLSFRLSDNAAVAMGGLTGYDKVPLKYAGWSDAQFRAIAQAA